MTVIVQAKAWKASALIKYFDISLGGIAHSAWLKYDKTFSIQAAVDPTLS